ncbi:O-antigen ligase family protein [Roseibium sp.]|uniref:O-antigen ligase family protein n=1 Tax=Roseibium sp. TaxID=1936156 RepID=UPI003B503215
MRRFTLLGLRGLYSTFSRLFRSGLVLLCVFFSVSSGPFLSVLFQLGMVGWVTLLKNVKRIWLVTAVVFVVFYLLVEVLSDRPAIIAIVTNLSFNGYTAYLRVTLFDYGMAQVARTPLLGVGYNEWELPTWMSGSIDNYWLFIAITYGVPAFLAFFLAVVVALRGSSYAQFHPASTQFALRRGWCFVMISISLTLATVAIWGNMLALINFLIAAGLWMHTYDAKKEGGERPITSAAVPKPEKLGWTRPRAGKRGFARSR